MTHLKTELQKHYPHPVFGCECTTDNPPGERRLDVDWSEHIRDICVNATLEVLKIHAPEMAPLYEGMVDGCVGCEWKFDYRQESSSGEAFMKHVNEVIKNA